MSRIEGGCLCGAVRYRSGAEPVATAVCHCKHCQRQSGSAFSIIVGVPAASLEFSGTALAAFDDRGASGGAVRRRFCPRCGSPIVSEVEATPGLSWIKAGTLDDISWLKPALHLWCDSAQPWVALDPAATKFARNMPAG
ncbi:MAG: GFA family protein [Nevskia sp.]|nr:GFA family protein [Nevskia sp.]